MMKITRCGYTNNITTIDINIGNFYNGILLMTSIGFVLPRISLFLKDMYLINEMMQVKKSITRLYDGLSALITLSRPYLGDIIPSDLQKLYRDFYQPLINPGKSKVDFYNDADTGCNFSNLKGTSSTDSLSDLI